MPFPPILRDSQGNPIPQIWDGQNWQPYQGKTKSDDGAHIALGATIDAEATGNGTVIGLLKRLRTLLSRSAPTDGQTKADALVTQALMKALRSGDLTKEELLRAVLGALYVNPRASDGSELFTSSKPGAVQLNGRNAAPKKETLLTSTPLAGNASYQADLNLETRSINGYVGVVSIGLKIEADTPMKVFVYTVPFSGVPKAQDVILHDGGSRPTVMPMQLALTTQIRIYALNLSTNAQTRFRLTLIESALPEVEPLFVQVLPLDSGQIVLAAGASYSQVIAIPRVGRLSFNVAVAAGTACTVRAQWRDNTTGYIVAEDVATKTTASGTDYYNLSVDARSNEVALWITNNSGASATFKAHAYGYPR